MADGRSEELHDSDYTIPCRTSATRFNRTDRAGIVTLVLVTKATAADWGMHGITVNCIAPGPFLTDANRRWIRERPEFDAEVAASIPLGRWGDPKEIGGLAVYLASEASSFMTGSVLVLDGGKLLW